MDTQLYKFKTTHRKILSFIHTAVKQFNSLDAKHELPRVMVFTSINPQLNWKSFVDAIHGGVMDQQGKLSPDFTKTPVYTSTVPLLSHIDLYVWFQVSESGDRFYQASYFVNQDSKHVTSCTNLVKSLSHKSLSSMDNLVSLNLS
jgi:hypothetical protein